LNIPIAHVEAGLRSFDRSMPEEINRIVTDALSSFLFTPSCDADINLKREGISADKIFFVGNVMIDTLMMYRDRILNLSILDQFGLTARNYLFLTLHRPSSVDDKKVFEGILTALEEIQRNIPILFPIHPRTKQQLQEYKLNGLVESMPNLQLVKPLAYLANLHAIANAKIVLTDSGGIQEETTILGVPCLTLRENTERPVTVTEGTNKVIGMHPERIVAETKRLLNGDVVVGKIPELWDGKTSERIVEVLLNAQLIK
jgi:UDP-N-acetylglucosamine 2-epimerase (non-hydrolysing)